MVEDQDTQELNPNDPEARAIREAAMERAERVTAGEEPWTEEGDGSEDVPEPVDEPVGETGEPGNEVVESPEPVEPDEE